MANVLIVNSSFRKNSNSNIISAKMAEGASQAGHSVKTLDISRLHINPCHACYACAAPNSNGCVQNDDMSGAYPLILEADIIIFASPIYWFNLGGQIKQFIDRLFAIAMQKDQQGKSLFASKGIGAAMAFEGDDPFDSGAVNALRSLQDTCSYSGAKWLGAVYGCANDPGEIEQRPEVLKNAFEFGQALK